MKLDSSLFCQWQHTLQNFEVDQVAADNAFNLLVEAYSSSDRYYHTLKDIYHVLQTIDNLQAYTRNLAAVQLAAWFHFVAFRRCVTLLAPHPTCISEIKYESYNVQIKVESVRLNR